LIMEAAPRAEIVPAKIEHCSSEIDMDYVWIMKSST